MRKAIAAFEQEFSQWGLSLPAQDIVDRQAGHMERHGWRVDYSFGTDAFGEFLEYHARRAVANEPVIERHARVYHNGERNFVPAPPGAEAARSGVHPAGSERDGIRHGLDAPPHAAAVEGNGGGGDGRAPASNAAGAAARSVAPRPARASARPFHAETEYRSRIHRARRPTATAFAIGVGAAVLVARSDAHRTRDQESPHRSPPRRDAADSLALDPIVVYAPAVLGFAVDSAASRFTQPLVGTRSADPNRAEIVRPEHGMTPIIPERSEREETSCAGCDESWGEVSRSLTATAAAQSTVNSSTDHSDGMTTHGIKQSRRP